MTDVTRFAPSPTGFLHLGHAASALFAAAHAKPGGRFLLRIEDIDIARCRAVFADAVFEDLGWLGLVWETPVRRQSAHFDDYRKALDRLSDRGLLYPCFCTRGEIAAEISASASAPHGPDGPLYPGTCRRRSEAERQDRIATGEAYALRLDMQAAIRAAGPLTVTDAGQAETADPAQFGDVVLARKDTPASYHLCATFDDALQGVTLVTRAEDLRPAAHLHRLLQALLDWPAPHYLHHPVLTGPDGRKLSKRDGVTSLRDMRAAGATAAQIRATLGFL